MIPFENDNFCKNLKKHKKIGKFRKLPKYANSVKIYFIYYFRHQFLPDNISINKITPIFKKCLKYLQPMS